MKKKIQVLLNPVAGKGVAGKIEQLIKSSSLHDKYDVTITFTQYAGHATELAKQAVHNGYNAVIATGGDGTVNETGRGLVHTDVALGIIPTGSGNGLARHLGMSVNPVKAIRQLADAETEKIDSLLINNRFAVNVSGFGFDGYVAWLFNHSGKRGLSNYTKISMQEYFKYPPAEFEMSVNNRLMKLNGHMLVIANASQFGNAAVIAPKANLYDGKADFIHVSKPPLWLMPAFFLKLFTGKLSDNKYVHSISADEFYVKASRPLHLHIDGEACDPVEEVHVKVNPLSLNILKGVNS